MYERVERERIEEAGDNPPESLGASKAEFLEFASERDSWIEFLKSDDAEEILGSDHWEFSDMGMSVDLECETMFVGLRLAVEQLRTAGYLFT